MNPVFMHNMAAIQREREVPPVVKESLTKKAIIYIFTHAEARSSDMKKEFDLNYSPNGLIKHYIRKGFILNSPIKGRDSIYSIKAGLTLADFGIDNKKDGE